MSYTGYLQLRSRKEGIKTIVYDTYHYGAFKVARPIYMEEHYPTIYLLHVGGGYVDGDQYESAITVEEGAHLCVTTQSATKVYKTPAEPVLQRTNFYLEHEAVLEYLPDPLIMYEGAQFIQETNVYMEESSTFFMCDVMTPGWSPKGELFKYESIRSKLKLYIDNQLAVFDHLLLQPDTNIETLMKMEGYTHFGSLLAVHKKITDGLVDELYNHLAHIHTCHIGISKLSIHGCVLRVLSYNTQTVELIINEAYQFLRKKLLQKEGVELRKY
ncbi:urease accessory protein ureD [Priestia megaterium]|nr:urease accessory protein ureD [Priestia megaterium]